MDVYTNLALLVGLMVLTRFDLPWLDPAMSILVAVYILLEAVRLLHYGMRDVLDEQLPETIRHEIEKLIEDNKHPEGRLTKAGRLPPDRLQTSIG